MTEAEQAIADYRAAYEAAGDDACGTHPTNLRPAGDMVGVYSGVIEVWRMPIAQLRAMTARLQGGSDE